MSFISSLKKATPFSIYLMLYKGVLAMLPQEKRQQMRANKIIKYFRRKYVPIIKNLKPAPVIRNQVDTIWQFWTPPHDMATPEIVNACIRSVERHKGNRKHIVVTNETLNDYVKLPDYIMEKRRSENIDNAHFADLVRLELLHTYGGYWMDATVFMTGEIPKIIDDQDFFVYLTGTINTHSFMQNCFIRGNQGAYLLEAWRMLAHEYWRREYRNIDYFWIQMMFAALVKGNKTAAEYFEKMPHITQEPTHRLTPEWKQLLPFDPELWEKLQQESFWQKLSRHHKGPMPKNSWQEVLSKI